MVENQNRSVLFLCGGGTTVWVVPSRSKSWIRDVKDLEGSSSSLAFPNHVILPMLYTGVNLLELPTLLIVLYNKFIHETHCTEKPCNYSRF